MSTFQRRLGLLVAAIGVLVLASATYGFGSIAADRIVNVQTASDETALLSIENVADDGITVRTATSGDANQTLRLTNNFESDLDTLDVRITDVSGSVAPGDLSVDVAERLGTGETATVGLYCDGPNGVQSDGTVTVTVAISGSGDDISVETSETIAGVTVSCPTESTPTPTPTPVSTS